MTSFTDLTVGSNTKVQCVNVSVDGVNISWTNSSGHTVSSSNELVLSNVTSLLHNGTVYTCTAVIATNPLSCVTQTRTITVTVKGMQNLVM